MRSGNDGRGTGKRVAAKRGTTGIPSGLHTHQVGTWLARTPRVIERFHIPRLLIAAGQLVIAYFVDVSCAIVLAQAVAGEAVASEDYRVNVIGQLVLNSFLERVTGDIHNYARKPGEALLGM